MRKELIIPFDGFYESPSAARIDGVAEDYFTNDAGEYWPGYDKWWSKLNWENAHLEYAREYVRWMGEELELDIRFTELDSPRFYNYHSDRIVATLPMGQVEMVREGTDDKMLDRRARRMFTSRPGFWSRYDPDFRTWGDLADWDHNQLHCMFMAWLDMQEVETMGMVEEFIMGDLHEPITDWLQKDAPQELFDEFWEWRDREGCP